VTLCPIISFHDWQILFSCLFQTIRVQGAQGRYSLHPPASHATGYQWAVNGTHRPQNEAVWPLASYII